MALVTQAPLLGQRAIQKGSIFLRCLLWGQLLIGLPCRHILPV